MFIPSLEGHLVVDLETVGVLSPRRDLSTRNYRNKEEVPTQPGVESKGERENIGLLDGKSSGVNLKQRIVVIQPKK